VSSMGDWGLLMRAGAFRTINFDEGMDTSFADGGADQPCDGPAPLGVLPLMGQAICATPNGAR
jgi:hypothetical protein